LIASAAITSANVPQPSGDLDWSPFRDNRLGFSLSVPRRVFEATQDDPTASLAARTERRSGAVFRSTDGRAYLQVAAFENVELTSPAQLMRRMESETYGNARITFRRFEDRFFILSGNRAGLEFYERVSFACSGRLISVWAMSYPVSERPLYDRIVEAIARSFRPAATGPECD
jgi:hypothetical protein